MACSRTPRHLHIRAAAQGQPSTSAPPPTAPSAPLRSRTASRLLSGAAAVLVSVAAVAAGPTPAQAADLELGAEVFQNNCAVCHAGGLNNIKGEEKHTLKLDALTKYKIDTVEAIVNQVNVGKDAMPPFRNVLSPEEIEAVASYVLDQAVGDKW